MNLNFRTIELSDKLLLDTLAKSAFNQVSELSFAHIYLWRNESGIKIALGDDWAILQLNIGGCYLYKPIGLLDQYPMMLDLVERYAHSLNQKVQLEYLDELECTKILEIKPHWIKSINDGLSDYIYDLSQMQAMQGHGFASLRKSVARFLRDCPNYSVDAMQDYDCDACVHVLNEWCKVKAEQKKEYSTAEVEMNLEAIRLRDKLGLNGFVLRVDGKIIGYQIDYASPVSNMIFVLCEKVILISPGASKMMDYVNCDHWLKKGYIYTNVGCDAGSKSLRATKMATSLEKRIDRYSITE